MSGFCTVLVEVGSQWQSELQILAFRISCKLDSLNSENSRLEGQVEQLQVGGQTMVKRCKV